MAVTPPENCRAVVGMLYVPWAVARFFDKRKKRNYVKAFVAYMLGMISFFAIAAAIGFLIDSLQVPFKK